MFIRQNNYILENPKIISSTKILSISDIHNNLRSLKNLLLLISREKPDFVCIPGDTLDMTNCDISEILKWIRKIVLISKVIISFGNHDLVEYNPSNKNGKWTISDNDEFRNKLDNIKNCILLGDLFEIYKDSLGICFSAINMPAFWFEKMNENKKYFQDTLSSISTNRLSDDSFNVLLSHSPNGLLENNKFISREDFEILKKINLILSGHNHGGLVPVSLQSFRKNQHGFVGPYSRINQENSFGIWTEQDLSLILSNGITKISESSELGFISRFLNNIFIPDVDRIILTSGKKHTLTLENRKINHF